MSAPPPDFDPKVSLLAGGAGAPPPIMMKGGGLNADYTSGGYRASMLTDPPGGPSVQKMQGGLRRGRKRERSRSRSRSHSGGGPRENAARRAAARQAAAEISRAAVAASRSGSPTNISGYSPSLGTSRTTRYTPPSQSPPPQGIRARARRGSNTSSIASNENPKPIMSSEEKALRIIMGLLAGAYIIKRDNKSKDQYDTVRERLERLFGTIMEGKYTHYIAHIFDDSVSNADIIKERIINVRNEILNDFMLLKIEQPLPSKDNFISLYNNIISLGSTGKLFDYYGNEITIDKLKEKLYLGKDSKDKKIYDCDFFLIILASLPRDSPIKTNPKFRQLIADCPMFIRTYEPPISLSKPATKREKTCEELVAEGNLYEAFFNRDGCTLSCSQLFILYRKQTLTDVQRQAVVAKLIDCDLNCDQLREIYQNPRTSEPIKNIVLFKAFSKNPSCDWIGCDELQRLIKLPNITDPATDPAIKNKILLAALNKSCQWLNCEQLEGLYAVADEHIKKQIVIHAFLYGDLWNKCAWMDCDALTLLYNTILPEQTVSLELKNIVLYKMYGTPNCVLSCAQLEALFNWPNRVITNEVKNAILTKAYTMTPKCPWAERIISPIMQSEDCAELRRIRDNENELAYIREVARRRYDSLNKCKCEELWSTFNAASAVEDQLIQLAELIKLNCEQPRICAELNRLLELNMRTPGSLTKAQETQIQTWHRQLGCDPPTPLACSELLDRFLDGEVALREQIKKSCDCNSLKDRILLPATSLVQKQSLFDIASQMKCDRASKCAMVEAILAVMPENDETTLRNKIVFAETYLVGCGRDFCKFLEDLYDSTDVGLKGDVFKKAVEAKCLWTCDVLYEQLLAASNENDEAIQAVVQTIGDCKETICKKLNEGYAAAATTTEKLGFLNIFRFLQCGVNVCQQLLGKVYNSANADDKFLLLQYAINWKVCNDSVKGDICAKLISLYDSELTDKTQLWDWIIGTSCELTCEQLQALYKNDNVPAETKNAVLAKAAEMAAEDEACKLWTCEAINAILAAPGRDQQYDKYYQNLLATANCQPPPPPPPQVDCDELMHMYAALPLGADDDAKEAIITNINDKNCNKQICDALDTKFTVPGYIAPDTDNIILEDYNLIDLAYRLSCKPEGYCLAVFSLKSKLKDRADGDPLKVAVNELYEDKCIVNPDCNALIDEYVQQDINTVDANRETLAQKIQTECKDAACDKIVDTLDMKPPENNSKWLQNQEILNHLYNAADLSLRIGCEIKLCDSLVLKNIIAHFKGIVEDSPIKAKFMELWARAKCKEEEKPPTCEELMQMYINAPDDQKISIFGKIASANCGEQICKIINDKFNESYSPNAATLDNDIKLFGMAAVLTGCKISCDALWKSYFAANDLQKQRIMYFIKSKLNDCYTCDSIKALYGVYPDKKAEIDTIRAKYNSEYPDNQCKFPCEVLMDKFKTSTSETYGQVIDDAEFNNCDWTCEQLNELYKAPNTTPEQLAKIRVKANSVNCQLDDCNILLRGFDERPDIAAKIAFIQNNEAFLSCSQACEKLKEIWSTATEEQEAVIRGFAAKVPGGCVLADKSAPWPPAGAWAVVFPDESVDVPELEDAKSKLPKYVNAEGKWSYAHPLYKNDATLVDGSDEYKAKFAAATWFTFSDGGKVIYKKKDGTVRGRHPYLRYKVENIEAIPPKFIDTVIEDPQSVDYKALTGKDPPKEQKGGAYEAANAGAGEFEGLPLDGSDIHFLLLDEANIPFAYDMIEGTGQRFTWSMGIDKDSLRECATNSDIFDRNVRGLIESLVGAATEDDKLQATIEAAAAARNAFLDNEDDTFDIVLPAEMPITDDGFAAANATIKAHCERRKENGENADECGEAAALERNDQTIRVNTLVLRYLCKQENLFPRKDVEAEENAAPAAPAAPAASAPAPQEPTKSCECHGIMLSEYKAALKVSGVIGDLLTDNIKGFQNFCRLLGQCQDVVPQQTVPCADIKKIMYQILKKRIDNYKALCAAGSGAQIGPLGTGAAAGSGAGAGAEAGAGAARRANALANAKKNNAAIAALKITDRPGVQYPNIYVINGLADNQTYKKRLPEASPNERAFYLLFKMMMLDKILGQKHFVDLNEFSRKNIKTVEELIKDIGTETITLDEKAAAKWQNKRQYIRDFYNTEFKQITGKTLPPAPQTNDEELLKVLLAETYKYVKPFSCYTVYNSDVGDSYLRQLPIFYDEKGILFTHKPEDLFADRTFTEFMGKKGPLPTLLRSKIRGSKVFNTIYFKASTPPVVDVSNQPREYAFSYVAFEGNYIVMGHLLSDEARGIVPSVYPEINPLLNAEGNCTSKPEGAAEPSKEEGAAEEEEGAAEPSKEEGAGGEEEGAAGGEEEGAAGGEEEGAAGEDAGAGGEGAAGGEEADAGGEDGEEEEGAAAAGGEDGEEEEGAAAAGGEDGEEEDAAAAGGEDADAGGEEEGAAGGEEEGAADAEGEKEGAAGGEDAAEEKGSAAAAIVREGVAAVGAPPISSGRKAKVHNIFTPRQVEELKRSGSTNNSIQRAANQQLNFITRKKKTFAERMANRNMTRKAFTRNGSSPLEHKQKKLEEGIRQEAEKEAARIIAENSAKKAKAAKMEEIIASNPLAAGTGVETMKYPGLLSGTTLTRQQSSRVAPQPVQVVSGRPGPYTPEGRRRTAAAKTFRNGKARQTHLANFMASNKHVKGGHRTRKLRRNK